jgi:hypothetical protein
MARGIAGMIGWGYRHQFQAAAASPPAEGDSIILESGEYILTEDGDQILVEG